MIQIKPQPGPQKLALKSRAEILFFGGGAGGGKTYLLLLDPLYDYANPEFNAVIFRRSTVQVRNPGGMWDESYKLYYHANARPREAFLEWTFPSGMGVKFAHLENEKTIYDWQGAQVPYIGFDELTHFSETQFTYMLSRNRSVSGVKGRIRATCNPDVNSWVRQWVDWWIDKDGFPIPERSGVIRYFIRTDEKIIWGNSKKELYAIYGRGPEIIPKSFTFIPALIDDNKILLEKDPGYMANLLALNRVDRERLRRGNWNIRASAGMLFKRDWFKIIEAIPGGWIRAVRFWDRAATKPSEENTDPDWTRGLLMLSYPNGKFVVADLRSMRDTPGQVEDLVKNVACHDGFQVMVKSQQDPGSAGVAEAEYFTTMLAGFNVETETMPRDKITRAKPVSAQCEVGNVDVVRAPWNEEFFLELENFSEDYKGHDDIVDCMSGSFNELTGQGASIFDNL